VKIGAKLARFNCSGVISFLLRERQVLPELRLLLQELPVPELRLLRELRPSREPLLFRPELRQPQELRREHPPAELSGR
jgi:hypothetical protein